ncbi:MAG: hypothetical protein ACFFDS_07955 [Candidatus Thorarchaeota archaeon]
MKVYRIIEGDLSLLKEPFRFLKGDVYVIEAEKTLWIWLGSKSFVDDKFVGVWGAKVLQEQNKDLKIKTVNENEEPADFKNLVKFEVIEGDTPRLLKKVEKRFEKDYRLLRIKQDKNGEITTSEIPIDYSGFDSNDAFVLDAFNEIYVWLGKDSQVKEKYEAGKITRALEVERKRIPIVYVIEQEDEPAGFRDLVYKLALRDGVIELRKTVDKGKIDTRRKRWWEFWK